MKEGKIVPARITCELQKKCMEKNDKEYKNFLCDGFPIMILKYFIFYF